MLKKKFIPRKLQKIPILYDSYGPYGIEVYFVNSSNQNDKAAGFPFFFNFEISDLEKKTIFVYRQISIFNQQFSFNVC